jgi:hypothetical protein
MTAKCIWRFVASIGLGLIGSTLGLTNARPAHAQTPEAIIAYVRAKQADCTFTGYHQVYRGPLPGASGAVTVATYDVEACGGGFATPYNSYTMFGIFSAEGAAVREWPVHNNPIAGRLGSVDVVSGRIVVDWVSPGPTDSNCCWSIKHRTVLVLRNGRAETVGATQAATAQPRPVVPVGEADKFDPPIAPSVTRAGGQASPGSPHAGAMLTCMYYADYTIKQLVSGKGADAISVTPAAGRNRPPCGIQGDPGEILLPGARGFMFDGLKGPFVIIQAADGYRFIVFSALTGQPIYHDSKMDLQAAEAHGDALTLRYVRLVSSPCSLANAAAEQCWRRTASEARLAAALAMQPAPAALCAASYAQTGIDTNDPSEFGYAVTAEVRLDGAARVLDRSALLFCRPRP